MRIRCENATIHYHNRHIFCNPDHLSVANLIQLRNQKVHLQNDGICIYTPFRRFLTIPCKTLFLPRIICNFSFSLVSPSFLRSFFANFKYQCKFWKRCSVLLRTNNRGHYDGDEHKDERPTCFAHPPTHRQNWETLTQSVPLRVSLLSSSESYQSYCECGEKGQVRQDDTKN